MKFISSLPIHEERRRTSSSPPTMESATSQKPHLDVSASAGDKEATNVGHRVEEEREEKDGSFSSDESELDLELGLVVDNNNEISDDEDKEEVHLSNVEIIRDCRICHMSLDEESGGGLPIDLGCSCKDDLAASHRHCAEAWFKIKGNKTCEICGSVARNVAGPTEAETNVEQWSDQGNEQAAVASSSGATAGNSQADQSNTTRYFWQGHRFLNFLLACMVFAFVISWLFHFNVPS